MSPLDQRSTPNIFAPLGDCSRALHPLVQLTVVSRGSALIPPVTPRPHRGPRTITRNHFKDRRLTPQITTSLSRVLRPRSRSSWETSQEVTNLKIAPQQARLTVEFLRVGFPKRKYTFGDISSHFDPFKPHSACYNNPPLEGHRLLLVSH